MKLSALILLLASSIVMANPLHYSDYAGEEARIIRTLSVEDINTLKNGRGWGLAKAAELNGVPGPTHLLQMKDEISLQGEKLARIEEIFQDMKVEAQELGLRLIESEMKLNQAFALRRMNSHRLKKVLKNNSTIRKKLRFVHLNAHLKSLDYLSDEQVALYNQLRGYNLILPSDQANGHHH